jgi:uncharacterized lipoprotein YajG
VNVPLRFVPLVLGLLVLLLQGCSLRPQNIKLDPPVEVSPSSVGQGKIVWVQVRDVRVRKTLGNVGDPDGKFTQVSVDDDSPGLPACPRPCARSVLLPSPPRARTAASW